MTTSFFQDRAWQLASSVTAVNVLIAGSFSMAGLISPLSIMPTGYSATQASSLFAMYAAARSIPLALMVLATIYKRATSALLLLGTLAGIIQLLDAGVGLLQHDLGKFAGPLIIVALQFYVMFLLRRSVRSTLQGAR